MHTVKLDVEKRDVSVPAKKVRLNKLIPGVFYGKGEGATAVQVDYQTFRRIFLKGGYSQLIDMTIDGTTNKKAIIHDVAFNPITGKIEHIDFKRVSLKEKIHTRIPVHVEGVAPAVKDLGGVMNVARTQIEVKCLPTHIPQFIAVDISGLKEMPSAFHVSELAPMDGVEILDSPESPIVIINAPRVEEEVATEEVAAEGEATEGEAEKKEGAEAGESGKE